MLGAGTGLGKAIILPCVLPSCGRRRALRDSPLPDLAQSNGCGSFAGKLFIPDGFVDCSRVLPSEGGHSLFPFKGQEEAAFQEFLLRMTKRKEAIGDMVVTGSGLSAIYAYHNDDNFLRPSPEIAAKINGAIPNLPAPGMASPGSGSDPLVKSLEWLARFYGRVARNFVLEVLALGGVYLSGGMLEHVPALLGHSAFAAEFRGSESQHELLQEVPVNWVSNQEVGLWGAALYSLQLLSQDNLPQA
jgi:glucokinase